MTQTSVRALVLAFLVPIPLLAQADAERAAATITERDFARRVGVIAHDSMLGRDTPSPGLDMTAAWAASELRAMGLRGGAADGGFIQRYPLERVALDPARSRLVADGVRADVGADLLPLVGPATDMDATGEVALVSGSANPGAVVRDAALRGKHVVIVQRAGVPDVDRSLLALLFGLRNAGAASVLVTSDLADDAWSTARERALAPAVRKGWGEDAPGAGDVPMLLARLEAVERLLAGREVDLAALQARSAASARVERVAGPSASLTLRSAVERIGAPNVVAILEGSDPDLRGEYVVFSGHMDHVGTGPPNQDGDSIFNGADDDASGTVAVIEVAEAMAALPTAPRRSMMFLLVSGEEHGLWGSEYFAENPSVPVDALVANFNTDMVARNWPDTIVAIGKEHSDLGETLERVNARHPELGMTAIDDLWPDESFYTRSDHFNFARKGVPILFFFNGTHEDYHGRDDEPDRINAEKAARVARLVFYLGLEVGNTTERPRWNPESYRRIVSDR